jgi:phage-related protein
MPDIAPGVAELRLRGEDRQFRVFYLIADERGILVFHAFTKKSATKPRSELETAKRRLKEILQ